ncbi:lysozyme g-like isoform X1 [Vanacampus margaritifer]
MGYGDIMKVDTSGASALTARQDGLPYEGAEASHNMAETDLNALNVYKEIIQKVGQQKGIDPAIIASIISRQSRGGKVLKEGWGDDGNCWGLMQVCKHFYNDVALLTSPLLYVQISKNYHTPKGGWDSEEHIRQGTDILIGVIGNIKTIFRAWTPEQQLKGGLAAYNCGPRAVRAYDRVDENTSGGDFSNDVVARAQWYKRHGGF